MFEYDNYIFDLDGTLIDTAPRILGCLQKSLQKFGLDTDKESFNNSLIGPKLYDILEVLGVSEELKDMIVKDFRTTYNDDPCIDAKPFLGVIEYLQQLKKQNKKLFVATNKPYVPTLKLLERYFETKFDDIITPDKFMGKNMNKAEMLGYLIEKYGLKLSDTVMFGDTLGDWMAAQKNGCKFVFFAGGYEGDKDKLAVGADKIFYKYKDLL